MALTAVYDLQQDQRGRLFLVLQRVCAFSTRSGAQLATHHRGCHELTETLNQNGSRGLVTSMAQSHMQVVTLHAAIRLCDIDRVTRQGGGH